MQELRLQMQKIKKTLLIDERRKNIVTMLAQSMTETEIAKEVGVHVSTISRDITYLKEQSQQFIYNLAKSDLAFYYQLNLNSIDQVKRRAWDIYNDNDTELKDKLIALKIIKECEETKFAMFKYGPFLMSVKSLEEKLNRIESNRSS